MKKTCLLTIVISVLSFIAHAQTLKSPDGRFQLNVSVDQQGRPAYELSFDGKPVILRSGLGLELKKEVEGKQETFDNTKHTDASTIDEKADLINGFQIKSTKTDTFDETWKTVWGEEDKIRNHYNHQNNQG